MRTRSDVHEKLAAALTEIVDGDVELISSHRRAWASATFVGARHRYRLTMPDITDAKLEALSCGLREHEFDFPGHLVADICVRELSRREECDAVLEIEVLTVELA